MGEENFHEGIQDFLALFKKKHNEKINMKKFFQLEVRSIALKLKTNRNYYAI